MFFKKNNIYFIALTIAWMVTFSQATEKRGFIMTAPNTFTMGKSEKLCFTFHDIDTNMDVTVSFMAESNSKGTTPQFVTKIFRFEQGHVNKCVHLNIPLIENLSNYNKYSLSVLGSAIDETIDYSFNKTMSIKELRAPGLVTFIETDKPIYKPGQVLKFRILTIDHELLPITETLEEVFIKDPSGNRIAQWKNVNRDDGLGDFEMPISDEPILGKWSIHLKSGSISETKSFKIEEYVLPKFQVTIKPPPYVYVTDKEFKGQVCAQYTYGKPVIGDVEMIVGIKQKRSGGGYRGRQRPSLPLKMKINQCVDFTVPTKELLLRDSSFTLWNNFVNVFASVTEEATGIKLNGTVSVRIETQRYKIDGQYLNDFFKPGFPYMGKGILQNPDGTPAPFKELMFSVSGSKELEQRKPILTDENGVFPVYISYVGDHVKYLHVQVNFEEPGSDNYREHRMRSVYFSKRVRQWYSRSGYGVQVMNIDKPMECGKQYEVNVTYMTMPDTTTTFYYQALTKFGQVVEKGHISHFFQRHDYNIKVNARRKRDVDVSDVPDLEDVDELPGEKAEEEEESEGTPVRESEEEEEEEEKPEHISHFKIKLDVKPEMSGSVRLLVYSVRPDGEVIADSQDFVVAPCFKNKVSMKFNKEQGLPGSPVDLVIKAAPGSLCSVGLVDKSVYLLQAGNQLSSAKVTSEVDKLSIEPEMFDFGGKHCNDGESESGEVLPPWGPQPAPRRPPGPMERRKKRSSPPIYGRMTSSYYDSIRAFKDIGISVISDLEIETRPCWKEPPIVYYSVAEDRGPGGAPVPLAGLDGMDGRVMRRKSSRNNKKTQKAVEIRSYFPETWLFDVEKVGATGELTLKKNLPHTITEWVGSGFCSNTNAGLGVADVTRIKGFQPFFVSFTLPYSVIRGEKVPILVTVFNYLTECLVIDLRLGASQNYKINGSDFGQVCVCGNEQKSHTFFIVPSALGKINVTVNALSGDYSMICGNDITTKKLTGEGASDAVIRELLVEAEGIEEDYSLSSLICPEENGYSTTLDLNLPENLIPDSARANLAVVGDLMGPTLSGLDSLLTLPVGCGEQNMITFVPNIYVLQYLTATNQLTSKIEAKALSHMKRGYQRELNYKHNDGSYSAFGNSDPSGSMWLTAFVVKSFAQSKPYIFIDDMHLNHSINWFKSKQLENGCFPQVGRVLHKGMKGGLSGGSSTVGLTTYVLLAMLEAGLKSDSTAVEAAIGCLDSQTIDTTDPYLVALMAYAYSLYDSTNKRALDMMEALQTLSVNKDGLTHWERPSQPQMELSESWKPHHKAASADVELTSYALMAILKHKGKAGVTEALPIVKWLTKQRNARGGFASTQDTIVALQALAQYAALVYKSDTVVYITAQGSNLDPTTFKVHNENQLLLQTKHIKIPDLLMIKANGTGCALLQANVKYNIKESIKETPAFTVNVHVTRRKSASCKTRTIGICTTYTRPDEASNMAVVEIRMVSGWIPVKESILKLVKNSEEGIKRYEINKNYVYLYYNELTKTQKCFTFDVEQHMEIEYAKPGYVKVYDYYEHDLVVIKDYAILVGCSNTKEDLRHLTVEEFDALNNGDEFVGQLRVPAEKLNRGMNAPPVPFKNEEVPVVISAPAEEAGCPLCVTVDLSALNVTELYCSHDVVYKMVIRRDDTMRLMAKFGSKIKGKEVVNKYVDYMMEGNCNCHFFEQEDPTYQKYALFAMDSHLTKVGNKFKLKLTDSSVAVVLTRELETTLYHMYKTVNC